MSLSEVKIFSDSQIQKLINNNDYVSAADYLFKTQLNNWELMKRNYDALNKVQAKSFWYDGFKMKVQFNPERIKSTSAAVDENSISNRPCFLCSENLPFEQKGIILRNHFFLLCNPYPILPQHFTITSLIHEPQRISKDFSEILELSKMLSPKYTLLYNGPACGASAPDHLHFQAVTKQLIPIENDIQQMKNDFGKTVWGDEFISITFIDDGLRKIVLIESHKQSLIEKSFSKLTDIFKIVSPSDPEPMMNLLISYFEEIGWNLIVFLRNKHRPACFFDDDPDKILISPAAVDLGGLLVTTRESDFVQIDKEFLQGIINEVSLDNETFYLIETKVKTEMI